MLTYLGNGRYKTNKTFIFAGVKVPAGFHTDLASTPRIFWNIFPPFGKYEQAAIVHDFLYHFGIGTKKEADIKFLHGMKLLQVPFWKRRLMFRAVRLFGKGNFK